MISSLEMPSHVLSSALQRNGHLQEVEARGWDFSKQCSPYARSVQSSDWKLLSGTGCKVFALGFRCHIFKPDKTICSSPSGVIFALCFFFFFPMVLLRAGLGHVEERQ